MTASSTTPATAPASCWSLQLAGKARSRKRTATTTNSGMKATTTSVSSGDSTAMTTSATTSSVTLAATIGSWLRNSCTSVTSAVARVMTSPGRGPSWRAASRCWSWWWMAMRRSFCTSRPTRPPSDRRASLNT